MTEILTPFLAAFIVAYALEPISKRLSTWGIPRSLAALLTLILGLMIGTALTLLLLNLLQNEIPLIKKQFPGWLLGVQEWLAPKLASLEIHLDWNELRSQATQKITSQISDNANSLVSSTMGTILASSSSIVSGLTNFILSLFITFYLLLDWENFFKGLGKLIPNQYRADTYRLAHEADDLLSQYLRGQVLVIATLAAFYSIGMTIIGVKSAVALGAFTGLVVVVPYIGFLLGFILSLMATLLQFGYGSEFLAVLALFGAGQMLESFFLTPRFVGERIGLHPVAVLFALLFFGQLFGFFGILLALPMAAICLVLIRYLKNKYTNSEWFKKH